MKELTIEEKAKRYDEAICDFSDLRTWKYIADYVLTKWCGNGQYLDNPYLTTIAEVLQKKYYLEQKQGEQKPAEEYNITGIGSKNAQGKLGEMIKNLKPVNEILEQKSAWSEEDEKILNLVIARLHSHSNVEAEEYDKEYHWLKSLKDRVQPQQKQEWNEEDKEKLDRIISIIHCYTGTVQEENELKDWLKSLRPQKQFKWSEEDRNKISDYLYCLNVGFTQTAAKQIVKDIYDLLRPQKQWKPSDEQMKMLENVRKILHTNKDIYSKVNNLMYDFEELIRTLKKLREDKI